MSPFQILLNKYIAGSLSDSELQEFLKLLPANKGLLEEKILSDLQAHAYDGLLSTEGNDRILAGIKERSAKAVNRSPKWIPFIWKSVAAASVIFFIAVATHLYFIKTSAPANHITLQKESSLSVITPGGNHAVLTLSNGSTIVLDSAKNGNLLQEGNSKIVKVGDGTLAYYKETMNSRAPLFNTLNTPRGGQYEVRLPDGTHVWLNAASSLKFPTTFTGASREVELNGEAYFEVAKNPSMPFVVTVRQSKVVVLGTHFNINSYGDEKSINTTLLEGSVKFHSGATEKLLLPGQQSIFNNTTAALVVKQVDVNQVIAWKNGFFEFDNTDLESIMRQLSRWYNVDVSYRTAINENLYGGGISRKLSLPEVLHLLEVNGVRFKIEGKNLIVL